MENLLIGLGFLAALGVLIWGFRRMLRSRRLGRTNLGSPFFGDNRAGRRRQLHTDRQVIGK